MDCEYRCLKCNHYWRGFRVLWHECVTVGPGSCRTPCRGLGTRRTYRGPGMTECPRCRHLYVCWINAEEFLRALEPERTRDE